MKLIRRMWWKQAIPQEYRPTASPAEQRRHFSEAWHSIQSFVAYEDQELAKAQMLDLAIHAIGAEIAASSTYGFFCGKDTLHNDVYDLPRILQSNLQDLSLRQIDIDLCKVNAYTGPWNYASFSQAVETIAREGFQHTKSDACGYYFPELDFAIMQDGRHHTTAGIPGGHCVVSITEISVLPLLLSFMTDGAFFYGNKKSYRNADFRFALLFQAAKDLYSRYPSARELLAQQKNQVLLCPNVKNKDEGSFHFELLETCRTMQTKMTFWKEESELCHKRIKQQESEIERLKKEIGEQE